ncbi:MAG: RNA polymerase sigma factor RpoH [Betaproteobacteria bacterium]
MSSVLTLSDPVPSLASIDSYIQAVGRFPLLSQEEEMEFARQYRNDNDLEAARRLVLSHLRLVVALARGYMGYGLSQADLIQEGNIGLMKAVKRFDPERGVRLVSFAVHWIRAEMHEFILRNWRIVKIATTKAQRKLFFNLRSMKAGFNTLSPEEVDRMAEQLRVKPEEVVEMEKRLGGGDMPLEPGSDDDDDTFSPIAYLSDPEDEPGRILEHAETELGRTEGLAQALGALDPRSRRIIEARWLQEAETATLQQLADEYGVSAERIRQIEVQAMKKLKASLAELA